MGAQGSGESSAKQTLQLKWFGFEGATQKNKPPTASPLCSLGKSAASVLVGRGKTSVRDGFVRLGGTLSLKQTPGFFLLPGTRL